MKYKKCKVLLVSENINEVKNWIKEIKECIFFKKVENTEIRKCFFESENITDYRTEVYFESKASKNNIYFSMNNIKSNPIKFF
jgi:penicillin-binding protein-related factor A (putative recombinase)